MVIIEILGYLILPMLNKVLFIMLVMACLNTFRHTYYFVQAFFKSNEEVPTKYKLSDVSLFLLGISISYIITVIFTGIQI
jgi:uncharacterized membrane protein YbaN (DUF454 family)